MFEIILSKLSAQDLIHCNCTVDIFIDMEIILSFCFPRCHSFNILNSAEKDNVMF